MLDRSATQRKSPRGRWRRRLARALPLALIALGLLFAGLTVRVNDGTAVGALRNLVFDEYQRLDPRPYDPASPVRIVTIDEASLAELGQWPWPRAVLADIINTLTGMGAAAIGLDMILAEPDRMSPESIAELMPEGDRRNALLTALDGAPDNDTLLAAALGASPSVLGVSLDKAPRETNGAPPLVAKTGFAFAGDDPRAFIPAFSSATLPLPALERASAGLAALNWLPDRDRIVRQIQVLFQGGDGTLIPGLAGETLRIAQGASTMVVRASNASGQSAFGEKTGINAVRIGGLDVPTTADGAVRLHFSRNDEARQIPAWTVVRGTVDPDEIAGRIILIGATAPGLLDIQATPLEEAVPGVELHAQLIDHMVFGTSLERPDWSLGLEIVVFIALTILFAVAASALSPMLSFGVGIVLLTAVVGASYALFRTERLLVDPSFPVLGGALVLLATTSWVAIREGSEKRWVRSAFGRYVASDLVEDIATNHERLTLGGETKSMTLLFTDIRGFTTISEGMDAQGLTTFINAFLTPLTNVILSHRGTVDKYMGDAIMAFWNAPLDDPAHAPHSAEAALDMMQALDRFNAEHAGIYKPVAIGIGINTGECCVGNLGSSQRFDYSVIGDAVNIASRLEGQTKTYGVPILVGPETAVALMEAGYYCLSFDNIKVKGKEIAIEIFALLGGPNHPVPTRVAGAEGHMNEMTRAYRSGDLPAMAAAIAALEAANVPELRLVVALYAERLAALTMLTPAPEPVAAGS
ncbi:adenylate/guanylate cyclase domain-containing protein [Acuticoccus sp. MNP-M23]|uniref:CHASE2 domain-containing protein n=1 Tax=Acuticoccus sp. MNP-M23 TaxID=3072793 RepID=UPI0028153470|nr:adenylate/guanylate cyclase domain-containing protein [Acuticoccus sp. MNP-M23]WMS41150.1 adenylate/guanylate cyclase domain-containing protein [Acuticoccus sp. MNP-M23]